MAAWADKVQCHRQEMELRREYAQPVFYVLSSTVSWRELGLFFHQSEQQYNQTQRGHTSQVLCLNMAAAPGAQSRELWPAVKAEATQGPFLPPNCLSVLCSAVKGRADSCSARGLCTSAKQTMAQGLELQCHL